MESIKKLKRWWRKVDHSPPKKREKKGYSSSIVSPNRSEKIAIILKNI